MKSIKLKLQFYFRKLRQKPMSRNLMNACLCQSVVYAFYAMATEFAEHDILCTAITAVLHFSVLACLLWKSVGACQSYKAFKKVKYLYSVFKIMFLTFLSNFVLVKYQLTSTCLGWVVDNEGACFIKRSHCKKCFEILVLFFLNYFVLELMSFFS